MHKKMLRVSEKIQQLRLDHGEEVLLESDCQSLYFHPSEGGQCFGWDWRQRAFNLLNTLSRYRERYRQALREASERGEVVISGEQQIKLGGGI